MDEKMGAMEIIGSVLSIVDKAMDLIPNYEQRKKSEFRSLRMAYENEKSKDYPHRDDNLVGIYRDRLLRFIDIFAKDINQ